MLGELVRKTAHRDFAKSFVCVQHYACLLKLIWIIQTNSRNAAGQKVRREGGGNRGTDG